MVALFAGLFFNISPVVEKTMLLFRPMTIASVIVATCVLGSAATAQEFARLAGTYTGEQVRNAGGRFQMVIELKPDGSYTWTREGRFVTAGQLSGSGNSLTYANQAGSRGTVTVAGRRLTWRNTMTGNDYTVTVSR